MSGPNHPWLRGSTFKQHLYFSLLSTDPVNLLRRNFADHWSISSNDLYLFAIASDTVLDVTFITTSLGEIGQLKHE